MKYNKRAGITMMLILSFVSCNTNKLELEPVTKENTTGIWIGSHLYLDKGFYKPYPQILEFGADTLYYKNFENETRFKNAISFTRDSIKLDDNAYPIRKFYIQNETLNFARIMAQRIQKTEETVDIVKFDMLLSSSDWKIRNNPGTYRFNSREKNFQLINTNGTYTKYCYELISYADKVFLLKKGNQLDCDRDYQFIEQVISYDENSIETYGFHVEEFSINKYQKISKVQDDLKLVDFQLCNKYLNKSYPSDRYYGKGTTYNGGLYNIRKIFKESYKAPQGSTESGIFQVRFVVNCQGKAGMYETQAFDNDYKLKEFSDVIADQIFEITRSLQDWTPGRKSKSNETIDTYIYLSFRIKDGKIIRIYP